MLFGALAGLGAALAIPVLSLGPAPGRELFTTAGRPASGWSTSTASPIRAAISNRQHHDGVPGGGSGFGDEHRRFSSASRPVSCGWAPIVSPVPPMAMSPTRRYARTPAVRWASTAHRSSTSSAPATSRRSTSSTARRPSRAGRTAASAAADRDGRRRHVHGPRRLSGASRARASGTSRREGPTAGTTPVSRGAPAGRYS